MAKVKILVIDDESIIATDIQDMLKDEGYDVPAIASSGEEAIKKAEEIKPNLVLMNIGLKGNMDGIDTAVQIHNRFGIPIVYVTAYMDKRRLERAKIAEPFGYVIKPFEDKELSSAIKKALGGNPKEGL
jgi:CheY-like chemotaxis protein